MSPNILDHLNSYCHFLQREKKIYKVMRVLQHIKMKKRNGLEVGVA